MAHHFRHHCFLDMVVSACQHLHPHPVAIEGEHRVSLRYKYRFVASIGDERVLAIALSHEDAFLNLSVHVELIAVVTASHKEIVPCHLLHYVNGEHLHGVGLHVQNLEYSLQAECLARVGSEEITQYFRKLLLRLSFLFFLSLCHSDIILKIEYFIFSTLIGQSNKIILNFAN